MLRRSAEARGGSEAHTTARRLAQGLHRYGDAVGPGISTASLPRLQARPRRWLGCCSSRSRSLRNAWSRPQRVESQTLAGSALIAFINVLVVATIALIPDVNVGWAAAGADA
jgi:hypothetical protein